MGRERELAIRELVSAIGFVFSLKVFEGTHFAFTGGVICVLKFNSLS